MASKQLYELDSATLPLKDDDLLLVSLKSVAEKANFSRKATVANIASKVQENVSTLIDNAKYEILLECDNRYANKIDVYTKVEVDAFIAMVNPTINYITRDEAAETYADKWSVTLEFLVINNSLQEKLSLTDADSRYDIKDTTYSKAVIDEKFEALTANFPSIEDVYTNNEIDTKLDELKDVYSAISDVYTIEEVNNSIADISSLLTTMIDAISPFKIYQFNSDSASIIAKNNVINYIGIYERNLLAITLPSKDENKLTEFYIVIDNSLHNSNLEFSVAPQSNLKIFSETEQCFDVIPAWKICYLHFKQISNLYVLKVDRLILTAIEIAQTEPEQTEPEQTEPESTLHE